MSSHQRSFVSVERVSGNVAVVTLNRPKMNALSIALLEELHETVEELRADLPGAVVVYGGERIFAAGADITEFDPEDASVAHRVTEQFHETLSALAGLPRVTIAAITGYALGGGCELALACDFRVVASNAKLGQPEILLGIIPGGGGTQRLARLIGTARAKELILTGRQVGAEEAEAIGLADKVVPAEKVLEEAVAMATFYAKGALVAQGLAKRAIDEGANLSIQDGLALERELFVQAFATQDARIGIESFKEYGPGRAEFVGR